MSTEQDIPTLRRWVWQRLSLLPIIWLCAYSATLGQITHFQWGWSEALLWCLGCVLILALWGLWIEHRWVLPLSRFQQHSHELLTTKAFDPYPIQGHGAIADISATFNQFLAERKRQVVPLRAHILAISHGDFDAQLTSAPKGYFIEVHQALNRGAQQCQRWMRLLTQHFEQQAKGQFSPIQVQGFSGDFLQAADECQAAQAAMQNFIGTLKAMAESTRLGHFQYTLQTQTQGEYRSTLQRFSQAMWALNQSVDTVIHMHSNASQPSHTEPFSSAPGIWQEVCDTLQAGLKHIEQLQAAQQLHTQQTQEALRPFQALSQAYAAQCHRHSQTLKHLCTQAQSLSQQANQTAHAAEKSQVLGDQVVQGAKQCQQLIEQAQHSMQSLQAIGSQVRDASLLIAKIADETKLLSLNASAEATQAGSSGSGFAVVAHEVQSLAQAASDASSQIQSVIAASVLSIQGALGSAHSSAQAMHDILQHIQQLQQQTQEIHQSCHLQAQAMQSFSKGIQHSHQALQETSETWHRCAHIGQSIDLLLEQLAQQQTLDGLPHA